VGNSNTTPGRLILRLAIYFAALLGLIVATIVWQPTALDYLPFGGSNVLEKSSGGLDLEVTHSRLSIAAGEPADSSGTQSAEVVSRVMLFLAATLLSTLLVMVPVTWTYSATRYDMGPSKSFVRALLVLPLCASTVVLLIQDSLALAFGLAALVAAVRFRVSLSDAIDGIYIFAAICVGLAAGIGYLGIAAVMAMFFCLTNALLWLVDYGRNPIDELRRERKREKLKHS